MTKKELFTKAHQMTREIKAVYTNVDYKFQLGLCLTYLQEGAVEMVELKGSEKQVAWAEKIRESVRAEILEAIEKVEFTEKQIKAVEKIREDMESSDSNFWIESFKSVKFGETTLERYLNTTIAARRIFKAIKDSRE